MRKFKYALAFVLALVAMSCTEEAVGPLYEDDPIGTPPPPPPGKP